MNIDLSTHSSSSIYHLMTQTIVPRPIAWVLSQNEGDNASESLNLAPFSYFNAVCSDPPLCMLSMGKKPNGSAKDTSVNLELGKHCIIHIAPDHLADAVTATAATLNYGKSEIQENNIELATHKDWPLQRIKDCPIAFLCKVHSRNEIGNAPQQLVFVEILEIYIDDNAATESNGRIKIDAAKIKPLARLGANQYASLGEVFSKSRPD